MRLTYNHNPPFFLYKSNKDFCQSTNFDVFIRFSTKIDVFRQSSTEAVRGSQGLSEAVSYLNTKKIKKHPCEALRASQRCVFIYADS
jgi:hypothetical protein